MNMFSHYNGYRHSITRWHPNLRTRTSHAARQVTEVVANVGGIGTRTQSLIKYANKNSATRIAEQHMKTTENYCRFIWYFCQCWLRWNDSGKK